MPSKKIKNLILVLLLAAISFGIYFNSLQGGFLIDDFSGISNNPVIQNLKNFISKDFRIHQSILWDASHALNWHFGGGKPLLFHIFNVLFYSGCVVLLFVLFNILFENVNLSFLAALIFAVHPIHSEVVSWISGGHYAFAGFFYLAALIAYTQADKSIFYILLSVIFSVLCFLSGNSVATLPLMFIIFDIFFRKKKFDRTVLLRILIIAAILVIAAMVAIKFFMTRDKTIHIIIQFRGARYLVVAVKALVYYVKILYLPIKRGLFHPFAYDALNIQYVTPAFFGGIAVIIASATLFVKCLKNHKPVSFGIMFFYVTFLPYSNIVPVCNVISERYMFLPSAGFCIFLAYLFLKVWNLINDKAESLKKVLRIIAMAALVLFISCYGILTLQHNRDFKDIITFWETNINNFPNGYEAYNNLAGSCFTVGSIEQALSYCWVTLLINPSQPRAWCNLGMIYRNKGNLDLSKFCYSEALRYDKTYFTAAQALNELEKECVAKEKAARDKKKKVEKSKKQR